MQSLFLSGAFDDDFKLKSAGGIAVVRDTNICMKLDSLQNSNLKFNGQKFQFDSQSLQFDGQNLQFDNQNVQVNSHNFQFGGQFFNRLSNI